MYVGKTVRALFHFSGGGGEVGGGGGGASYGDASRQDHEQNIVHVFVTTFFVCWVLLFVGVFCCC